MVVAQCQLVDILIETRPTSDHGDDFAVDNVLDFADILDALRLDVHHSQFRTGVFLLANPTNFKLRAHNLPILRGAAFRGYCRRTARYCRASRKP